MKQFKILLMCVLAVLIVPAVVRADAVTLPPSGDTSICSCADYNWGSGWFADKLYVGGNETRSLIKFDVSGIPPGSLINSATLVMGIREAGSDVTVEVHNVLKDWNELQATRDLAKTGSSWEVFMAYGASDIDAAVEDSIFIPAGTGVYGFDIAALTQAWVDGAVVNNGVILVPSATSAGSPVMFWAGYGFPRLEVNYTLLEDRLYEVISALQNAIDENTADIAANATEIGNLGTAINSLGAEYDAHTHEYLTGKGQGHNNTPAETSKP